MNTPLDHTQLKRAWQTAFELRLCPDAETLFAEVPDQNLNRHLQMCHLCREKREMPSLQLAAWRKLMQHLAGTRYQPARPGHPVPGQVWSLKNSLAGWGSDAHFHKPPRVLLLEHVEGTRGFKAVQLYGDRLLMGEGDVWLENDRFGFAQGWNCYSIHEDAMDGCWGAVPDHIVKQVQVAAAMAYAPVEEDSILYFFRRMEIDVGARVALPSVAMLVEEWENTVAASAVERFEKLLSPIAALCKKLKNSPQVLEIPGIAESILNLLLKTKLKPQYESSYAAADEESVLLVRFFDELPEEMRIENFKVKLTRNHWVNGNYFIAGHLNKTPPSTLTLLGLLTFNAVTLAETDQIGINDKYFEIVFEDVPYEASLDIRENVKLLLVRS